jgi:peptidoglycan/LPS O-acetylase OafA/YrhL
MRHLGVAASTVLSAALGACGFGLSLFFTLSAFLIGELLLRERAAVGTVRVKEFYIRRILRIWPLYYLCLALGVAWAFRMDPHGSDFAFLGWSAVFMGAWYVIIYWFTANPFYVLWSISVEEHFYLFVPWVIKYFDRTKLFAFCAFLVAAANGWLYFLGQTSLRTSRIWTNSFVQFECFASGILLCLFLRGRLPRFTRWQRFGVLVGGWICWLFASPRLNMMRAADVNPGSWLLISGYALSMLGSALVITAFLGIKPTFIPGWAVYLGRISYGLYAFHELALRCTAHLLARPHGIFGLHIPVIENSLTRASSALALTTLLAAVSYRYFEAPFLKLRKRHSTIESQPILARS